MHSLPSPPTPLPTSDGWVFRPLATNGDTWQRPTLCVVPPADGDTAPSTRVVVPDVTGMPLLDAALIYADAGMFVLPIDPTTKSPGSLVGKGWPKKSSRDPDQIRRWWSRWSHAGIALHTGPSTLVAFDLDDDAIPDELAWMREGAVQYTRSADVGSERGHCIFHTPDVFVSGKIALTDGMVVGEIRSGNTVIVAAPTPHTKAEGQYRWRGTDISQPIPVLPDVARGYLRPLGTTRAGGRMSVPAPSAEVRRARDEWTGNERPKPLDNLVNSIARRTRDTRDHTRNMLRIAACEARIGFYPLTTAVRAIKVATRESYSVRGEPDKFSEHEFARLVANGVGYALSRSVEEIREEATREYPDRNGHDVGAALGKSGIVKSEAPPRNTPLDLRRLRTEPSAPVTWMVPDLLARDSYASLSSAPGTGKSILARAIAVDASLGRSATDPTEAVEPAKVIYLDAENGQDWWRDGLDTMRAPLDLPNLSVVTFPDLGGLDTERGSREFLALIEDLAATMGGEVDLVVLDTVSRFIESGENDADTWSQFYRRAIQPLRDKHIAVLRLDHLGKDADKGPRGSSHKLSDVDADYRLTADKPGGDDLTLALGKRRRQHFAETLRLRRLDGPLRHEPSTDAMALGVTLASGQVVPADRQVAALVTELDGLGIPVSMGRSKAQRSYLATGGTVKASNAVWTAALKFRRNLAARTAQNGGGQP